ncbi:magnesium transporter CorA family protein [Fonticella tunisiensis]|uniref:Magnesium transporter n=1 Tax=Fonticella tunisiensis TaxID=1096341 RepID=A0A4R7KPY7_9CLOT|nr:magnesium transporter CorA family protein [Fonticella tunisiensis]TDT61181.1 magnesium transporter [Fonticella tunisiensis]
MKIYSLKREIEEIRKEEIDFNKDVFYWLNLTPDELKKLNKHIFEFNPSTVDECESISQVAKVDFFDEYVFLVLNSLKYEKGIVAPDEFNIFLGRKYIITVSRHDVKIIKELEDELLNYKNSVVFSKGMSPSKILYYILDKLILNDYDIINKLENVADSLEIQIMKNPDKQFVHALLHLRHQVHTLRRCIAPLRYIGDNLLSNENGVIDCGSINYFHRINSKINKLIFSLESLVQYIVLVREAFEAEIANKTNELMKLFTIVAMFFSPLTLITGIYGMNFKIPELSWKYGYFYSLGLMAFVSLVLFIYFKRKKWL